MLPAAIEQSGLRSHHGSTLEQEATPQSFVATALLSALLTVAIGVPAVGAASAKGPYDFSGDGSARTPAFRLPDPWSLNWSFDCSASVPGPGVFSVQVVAVDGHATRLDLRFPRLLRYDTVGSGIERYDHGGTRAFLRIASQCSWTLSVTGLAP